MWRFALKFKVDILVKYFKYQLLATCSVVPVLLVREFHRHFGQDYYKVGHKRRFIRDQMILVAL